LRSLDIGVEIAHKPASRHVADKRHVVASAEQCASPLALRHFALSEDADANDGLLGDLAEQVAADVVTAVVDRYYPGAFENEGAQSLLHFLDRIDASYHRRSLSSRYGRSQVHQETFPAAGNVSDEQEHRADVECAAQHRCHQRG